MAHNFEFIWNGLGGKATATDDEIALAFVNADLHSFVTVASLGVHAKKSKQYADAYELALWIKDIIKADLQSGKLLASRISIYDELLDEVRCIVLPTVAQICDGYLSADMYSCVATVESVLSHIDGWHHVPTKNKFYMRAAGGAVRLPKIDFFSNGEDASCETDYSSSQCQEKSNKSIAGQKGANRNPLTINKHHVYMLWLSYAAKSNGIGFSVKEFKATSAYNELVSSFDDEATPAIADSDISKWRSGMPGVSRRSYVSTLLNSKRLAALPHCLLKTMQDLAVEPSDLLRVLGQKLPATA